MRYASFPIAILAAAFCVPPGVRAADPPVPVLEVTGPTVVEVGRKCVITAATTAKKVTWKSPASCDVVALDGRRLAVWALPGSYTFTAMVPNGDDVASVDYVLTVTGPRPPPGPIVPDPIIPLPDGKFGLIKASRDGVLRVTNTAKAGDLAKANRGHASAVAAGAFAGPAKILEGWRASNNAAAAGADWKAWGEIVSARLAELHRLGHLPDNLSWSAAFNEISEGLEPRK